MYENVILEAIFFAFNNKFCFFAKRLKLRTMKKFLLLIIVAVFGLSNECFAQYSPVFIKVAPGYQTSGRERDAWYGMVGGRSSRSAKKYRSLSTQFPRVKKQLPFPIEKAIDPETGMTTAKWEDGSIYRGQMYYGEIIGAGMMFYADGSCYSGMWKNNLPNGKGTYISPEGIKYSVKSINGVPHGKGVIQDLDGKKYTARWEYGVIRKKSIKPLEEE